MSSWPPDPNVAPQEVPPSQPPPVLASWPTAPADAPQFLPQPQSFVNQQAPANYAIPGTIAPSVDPNALRPKELTLSAALALSAFAGAIACGVWYLMIYEVRTLPLWLLALCGAAIGKIALMGNPTNKLWVGVYAAGVSALSAFAALYFAGRSLIIDALGTNAKVPLWHSVNFTYELAKGEANDNPVVYLSIVGSIALAFFIGSGIKSNSRRFPKGSIVS